MPSSEACACASAWLLASFFRVLYPTIFLTLALANIWYLCSISPRSHLRAAGTFLGSVTTGMNMWGRLLNIFSSTTFGSTMMRRTSLGLFEYRMEVTMELMQTDFPEP